MKDLSLAARQGSEQCQQQLLPAMAVLTAHMNTRVLGRQCSVEGWQKCFGDCLCLSYRKLVIHAPKMLTKARPPVGRICLKMLMQSGTFLAGVTPVDMRELVGIRVPRRGDVCLGEVWDAINYPRRSEGNFT